MSERKAGRSIAAAVAILVALLVAGVWFFLGDSSGESPRRRGASSDALSSTASPRKPTRRPKERTRAVAAQEQPGPSPDGVLEVEVLSEDTPLSGAQVQLYKREPADVLSFPAQWSGWNGGVTGADGRQVFPAPPGSYFVTARAQELVSASVAVVHPSGAVRTSVRLRLVPGEELTGTTVVKETGDPVALAEIILTPHGFAPGSPGQVDAPEEESLFTTSNESGEFWLTGLAPGWYRAEARAPGHVTAVLPSVPIPFNGRVLFELVPGGWLEGVVLRGDGQPVAGAEVLATDKQEDARAFSDSEGRFSLEVRPGAYFVSARAGQEAGATEQRVVRASPGQRVQGLRIVLGEGARVSGQVLWRDGSPVQGARVEVRPHEASAASGLSGTDSGGLFSIAPLAAGAYDVQVFRPGAIRRTHGPIILAAGEQKVLTLTEEPLGRMECSILDQRGRPVEGALVRASAILTEGVADSEAMEVRTDAQGAFRFERLLPGRFRLEIRREPGSAPLAESILTVMAERGSGCPSRVFVPEDSESIVEGQVIQRSGAPLGVPGTVSVYRLSSPGKRFGKHMGRSTVDTRGRFRLALSPGLYSLYAEPLEPWELSSAGCDNSGWSRIQVEPGQNLETTILVEDARDSSLRLQVLESDGTPVRRTLLTVHLPPSHPTLAWTVRSTVARTDESGRLDVCPFPKMPEPRPSFAVSVSSLDGARAGRVDVPSGQREATARLRSVPSVRGRVIHKGGVPVRRGVTDIVFPGISGRRDSQEFMGDRFELRGLPLEPFQLFVTTDDGSKGSITLDPREGPLPDVEIPVHPAP